MACKTSTKPTKDSTATIGFDATHLGGKGDYEGSIPEDQHEHKAVNFFWVPAEAYWLHLHTSAKRPTDIGRIMIADMKCLLVCMPSKAVLAAFDRNVVPIFGRAFTNTLESRTLATLRDTLLPKLLSGGVERCPNS
jgi:hypothetical protein